MYLHVLAKMTRHCCLSCELGSHAVTFGYVISRNKACCGVAAHFGGAYYDPQYYVV